jgi:hypothetical protein
VTDAPTAPEVGDRALIEGGTTTVKDTPLLAWPLTVTTTLPVVAPVGTGTTIEVALQLVGVAVVPLNVRLLVPWVEPKFVPVIVTDVPTTPEVGERVVIEGGGITVKETPLLAWLPTVTTTLPVVAPLGTGTTIELALQLVGVAVVPLNLTVLVPWVEPKFVPVIVTDVPTTPEVGERVVIEGGGITVKDTPLLATPLAWTTTLPVLAPLGTGATIDVALQLVAAAVVPLNVTVLLPWVEPKAAPVIVTEVPTVPEVGDRLLIAGVERTEKETPLLFTPLACTTTFPVVAPLGTETSIEVALQLAGLASVPLKLTVLEPWADPKLAPVMVIEAPTAAELGEIVLMLGAETTVNETPLLATLLTVTTTLPVVAPLGTGATIEVALQLVGVDVIPLNLTMLVPWVDPKPVPLIVIDAPIAPEFGDRLLTTGVTVKLLPLLAAPPTVTTTFPVVAALGTGAMILVALQLAGVATVPLNLMVLDPWVDPKLLPEIVTEAPTLPDVGERLVMDGAAAKA